MRVPVHVDTYNVTVLYGSLDLYSREPPLYKGQLELAHRWY